MILFELNVSSNIDRFSFIEIPKKAEDENYKADTRVGVEVEYVPAKSA